MARTGQGKHHFKNDFRPTCQLQDVSLYSGTMAALNPYWFEPERTGNSEYDESGHD